MIQLMATTTLSIIMRVQVLTGKEVHIALRFESSVLPTGNGPTMGQENLGLADGEWAKKIPRAQNRNIDAKGSR